MSSRRFHYQTFRYQSNHGPARYSEPNESHRSAMTHSMHDRFSNNSDVNSRITDFYPEEASNYYIYTYKFQDNADESNTVFYDSNLRKYRTRSSIRNQAGGSLSNTFNSSFNYNLRNKNYYVNRNQYNRNTYEANRNIYPYNRKNYEYNTNTYEYNRNKGMNLNQNRPINSLNEKRREYAQNKYNRKEFIKNVDKNLREEEKRDEMLRKLKKEKDEMLDKNNYSSEKFEQKIIKNKLNNMEFQDEKHYNNNAYTVINLSGEKKNQNLNQLNESKNSQAQNHQYNKPNIMKNNDNSNEIEGNQNMQYSNPMENNQLYIEKLIQISQIPDEQDIQRKNSKMNSLGNSQNLQADKLSSSQNQQSSKKKSPIKSAKQKNENLNSNKLSQSSNKNNINNNQRSPIQNNQQIMEDNKINKNLNFDSQQNLPKEPLQDNQNQEKIEKKDLDNHNRDSNNNIMINNNNKEDIRQSNVSVLKRNEEKTIIIIPGQTLERKSISETLINPVEEIIQNPNGTTTSFIKQTKITTTTENVPIEDNKIKSIEGAPELPMIKQYITYEYKTVTTLNDNKEQEQDLRNSHKIYTFKNLENPQQNGSSSPNNYDKEGGHQGENEQGHIYGNKDRQGKNNDEDNFNLLSGEKKEEINDNFRNNMKIGGNQIGDENLGGSQTGAFGNNQENEEDEKLGDNQTGAFGNKQENLQNEKLIDKQNEDFENNQKKLQNEILIDNQNEDFENNQDKLQNEILIANQNEDFENNQENLQNKNLEDNQNDFENNQENLQNKNLEDNQNEDFENNQDNSQNINSVDNQNEDFENNQENVQNIEEYQNNEENQQDKINSEMQGSEQYENQEDNVENISDKKVGQDDNECEEKDKNDNYGKDQEGNNVRISQNNNILPEEFKNEKEVDNFLDEIDQKGDNATPEEKEKRNKCLINKFKNICKGGKNSEENLKKLAEILSKMNDIERKEFLSKLSKDFPKNGNIYKKLLKLVQSKTSRNNIHKGKGKGAVKKINENNNSSVGSHKIGLGSKGEKELFSKSVRIGDKQKYHFSKGISGHKEGFGAVLRNSEIVEVKDINPLKFDGLFLEITNYTNVNREKNPFEGPSPYCKFYKDRKLKIKQKITHMASGDMPIEDEKEKEN